MAIRDLDYNDLNPLTDFIIRAYNDYPLATWFEEEPKREEVERLFYNKLKGMAMHRLIDIVMEDHGIIAGECEIAKMEYNRGAVGIMVDDKYRGNRIGSALLDKAVGKAFEIGITIFIAEVAEQNLDGLKFFISNGFAPIGARTFGGKAKPHNIVLLQRIIK